MKNIRFFFYLKNFHFLVVKFSVYLNWACFRNEILMYEWIAKVRMLLVQAQDDLNLRTFPRAILCVSFTIIYI